MREDIKYTLMVAGMVVAWSVYYAVSKIVVGLTRAFPGSFIRGRRC